MKSFCLVSRIHQQQKKKTSCHESNSFDLFYSLQHKFVLRLRTLKTNHNLSNQNEWRMCLDFNLTIKNNFISEKKRTKIKQTNDTMWMFSIFYKKKNHSHLCFGHCIIVFRANAKQNTWELFSNSSLSYFIWIPHTNTCNVRFVMLFLFVMERREKREKTHYDVEK